MCLHALPRRIWYAVHLPNKIVRILPGDTFLPKTLQAEYPLFEICVANTYKDGLQLLDIRIENKHMEKLPVRSILSY